MENNYFKVTEAIKGVIYVKIIKTPKPSQFKEYMDWASSLLLINYNYVLIMDIIDVEYITPEQRKEIADIFINHKKRFQEKCLSFVYVNKKELPLAILEGIFITSPPPVPYKIYSTSFDAINYAKSLLELY